MYALGVFPLEVGWEALVLAIFPSLCYGLLTFPFILACVPYPSSTCRVDFSKTDTCPISPYPEWLGVVVKAGEYGSVRCRVLNGSKGSFPCSLLSSVSSSIDLDILDFFQAVPIPFLPFLSVRPWTCRGLDRPRLCPKTISYLYYRVWAITFLGSGLWAPTNKWARATNYWAPQ